MPRCLQAVLALVIFMSMVELAAQNPEPVRYTLRFLAPHTRCLEVTTVESRPVARKPHCGDFTSVHGATLVISLRRVLVEMLDRPGDPNGARTRQRWRSDC